MITNLVKYDVDLRETWRLVGRGVPLGFDPSIDEQDCYIFERLGPEPHDRSTAVMPVRVFWGTR